MNDTTRKGDIGVALATADLLRQGYDVLKPISDKLGYDLAIFDGKQFYRIQVKYRTICKGAIECRPLTSNIKHSTGKITSTKHNNDFDILCIYCPDTNKCYYINRKEYISSITLRVDKPVRHQRINIRLAKDYESIQGAVAQW
jgi:hypothetical protein